MEKFQIKRPAKRAVDAVKFERGGHDAQVDESFEGMPVRVDTVGAYVMAGVIPCRSGSYIYRKPDGLLDVMSKDQFEEQYEPYQDEPEPVDVERLEGDLAGVRKELELEKAAHDDTYKKGSSAIAALQEKLDAAEDKLKAANTGYEAAVKERDELEEKLVKLEHASPKVGGTKK